jgi:hypothetical protein
MTLPKEAVLKAISAFLPKNVKIELGEERGMPALIVSLDIPASEIAREHTGATAPGSLPVRADVVITSRDVDIRISNLDGTTSGALLFLDTYYMANPHPVFGRHLQMVLSGDHGGDPTAYLKVLPGQEEPAVVFENGVQAKSAGGDFPTTYHQYPEHKKETA